MESREISISQIKSVNGDEIHHELQAKITASESSSMLLDEKSDSPKNSNKLLIETKTPDVATSDTTGLQQASSPDPRWPYLGRWSASRNPASFDVSPSSVKSAATAASPHATETTTFLPALEINAAPPAFEDIAPPPDEATDQVPKESQELEAPLTQQDVPHQTEETIEKVPAPFVPSMGAWSKRLVLNLSPPSTPAEPSTPRSYDPQLVQSQIDNFWPSLEEGTNLKQKKCLVKGAPLSLNLPVAKLPPPELKEDGSLRFPWAARMNPATRNLYRASKPTFRLDGTPEIIIPTKVLQLGPENVGEYVIGQFHRCSVPSGGLMHAVVNRLWGRSCKIVSRKLGESSYLFHVPHKETRHWIIQRTVWHVDDCLMFVAPWNQVGTLKIPEISTVPAWVTLKNIPTSCYSRLGISHIASGLGEPMLTHKPRLDPFNIGGKDFGGNRA
ncbi:hypothetical protein Bca52824_009789 [Brassica carinata]|uniref:DUF4283 domain-containing protein n=1 Tax=Brassica carinata TaxID=52824 RepID=A0A8X7WBI8_BRACI|nr:hypothetical protein Bca52824_009789 [Brassica carinata]